MLCLVLHMTSSTFFFFSPRINSVKFSQNLEFTTFVCADPGVQTVT